MRASCLVLLVTTKLTSVGETWASLAIFTTVGFINSSTHDRVALMGARASSVLPANQAIANSDRILTNLAAQCFSNGQTYFSNVSQEEVLKAIKKSLHFFLGNIFYQYQFHTE
jgi:hypothetical protein